MSEVTPKYPVAYDDNASLLEAKDQAETTLSTSLTAVAMIVNVPDTSEFPSIGYLSIDREILKYESKTATAFNITDRGAQGTTAAIHNSGACVYHNVIAVHHNILKDTLIQIETELGLDIKAGYSNLGERLERLVRDFLVTEQLTSQVDGIKIDFVTTYNYYPGTLKVWLNGLKEVGIIEIVPNQVRIDPAPEVGDIIDVEYIKEV